MNKKTKKHTTIEGTWGKMEEVTDFLPPADQLVLKKPSEMVDVTLSLHKDTIDFFKKRAKGLDASYRFMMSSFISQYVQEQKKQRV